MARTPSRKVKRNARQAMRRASRRDYQADRDSGAINDYRPDPVLPTGLGGLINP